VANVGEVIAERFELVELAFSGGIGEIWKARDAVSGATVALKTVKGARTAEERFTREAMALAKLSHPSIVRYLAHGASPSGQRWLVMEWLEGEDLATRLSRAPLDVDESLELCRRVSEGLAEAHRAGFVHRDIKPSNLFLVDGRIDRVRILDFGVARIVSGGRPVTRPGMVVGTPGYLAPEQARGERDVGPPADVFGLGCVLFECLTGKRAFEGDRPLALLAKVLFASVPRVAELRPDVPAALDQLVNRMLARTPEDRPKHGLEVLSLLEVAMMRKTVLPPPVSERPPAITAAEQRVLSVVVAGGEAVKELGTLSPEEVAEARGRRRELADRAGARLENLADGSVVLTLSASGAATDQAVRAARAALELAKILPDRVIALATGLGVVAGRLPMGEVIERAVALLEAKEPGVRVDDVTRGLLDARFEVEESGGAHALRAVRELALAPRTLLGRPTPCVGREKELGMLDAIADACFDEPRAQAVLLVGAPGVGKSRVEEELLRRVRDRDETVRVWLARGDPMRAGSPFGMVAQALKNALGIVESAPVALRREALERTVGRFVDDEEGKRRVARFIGELVGTHFDDDDVQLVAARGDPVLMGDQMRRAFEDLVGAVCRHHPLVLVLDDLQWGDLPTITLVDAALRNLADHPLLVLAVARPEVNDLYPKLFEGRELTQIRVGELSAKASARFVHEFFGNACPDEDVVARLVERSNGNPFFLEELIRAHAEGESGALPSTVLAMVQARLEAMEPEARRVLRAASVFGADFWGGGVMALVGKERAEDVGEWLRILSEREVVAARETSRFANETEHVFRHALFREAAYRMLTPEDRELGHRLAGAWLETAGEREAALLAEHYDLGAQPGRAAPWWRRAAEEAFEGNDFDTALTLAERARKTGAQGAELGRIRLMMAEIKRWRGDNEAAERFGREAMTLLPLGSPEWCRAASEVAGAIGRLGKRDALTLLATSIVDTCMGGNAPDEWALTAMARVAIYHYYVGDPETPIRLRERIEASPGVFVPYTQAWLHMLRANEALFRGDLGAYLGEERAAKAAFEETGFARRVANESVNVGYAMLELGADQEAREVLSDAIEEADRLGLTDITLMAKHNFGRVLERLGELEEAAHIERACVDAFAARGDGRMEGGSQIYLASILVALGRLDDAEAATTRALALLEDVATLHPYALAAHARVLLARGRVDEAVEAAERAHDAMQALGAVEEGEALIRLVHAEALLAGGRVDDARAALAEATRRVDERAARIADPALRESFVTRVPENARTVALSRST
jgi:tetratricopeptide (TPR) repeat protein